ncbi:MAG TPA: hypothetical protein VN776_16270 [Terracidiphilus sp.]|nr:hypothetical protein [Terracidiphilus sp.]
MDWNKKESDAMELDRIDEILFSEEEILPSSGFLAAVMERVEREASAPPPIPFPWKRALPGFVLTAGVFGWVGVELARLGVPAMKQNAWAMPQLPPGLMITVEEAGWVALSLGLSLASWLLARLLAGRSGLL